MPTRDETSICGRYCASASQRLADYHAEVDGALPTGRYLTGEPVDLASLGEWRYRLRTSPYFSRGTTYAELFAKGRRTTAATEDAPSVAPSAPDWSPASWRGFWPSEGWKSSYRTRSQSSYSTLMAR